MMNHYHVLLRANEFPLFSLLRPLNSKYARWFRKKNKSRGYLFQDRFKSLATQDQGYIEELVRYIHLNPVRAGVCATLDELDRFPWCSHAVYIGKRKQTFEDTKAVLKRFGHDSDVALRQYRAFLHFIKAIKHPRPPKRLP
jgi:putative transposase